MVLIFLKHLKKSKLKIDAIKLEHYETSLKSSHDAKVVIDKAFFEGKLKIAHLIPNIHIK
ncbi:hypothetical protein FB1_26770 [Flavobacterium branchiophilum NBRC 15030 = ATCC 35035]|nr:hypothetical protein FB1_26770 [Flavobacterium branchiophilum NBRC 15030 = ATCC 35035]